MKKYFSIILSVILVSILLISCSKTPASLTVKNEWNTNYKYVFVHGLSGWGSYDMQNKFLKY